MNAPADRPAPILPASPNSLAVLAAAPTRRGMLAAMATLPAIGFTVPAATRSGHHADLFAQLAAYDADTKRLDAKRGLPQATWDAWEARGKALYATIEALPQTSANVAIKNRAIVSIVERVEDINDGDTVICRLLRHIVTGLSPEGC